MAHDTVQVKRVAHAPQNYTPERGATPPCPSASRMVLSSHLADHVSASALTGRPFTALPAAAPEQLPALPLRWWSWMWSAWRPAKSRRIVCSRGRMPGTEQHPDPPWLTIAFPGLLGRLSEGVAYASKLVPHHTVRQYIGTNISNNTVLWLLEEHSTPGYCGRKGAL